MKDIYIFKNGETIPAKIEKLFETHGPYTFEGKRLDQLSKVELLVDSSTSTIKQTGTASEHTQTSNMLGRAAVGGVLAGGAGAVIGGLSGKKESISSNVSSEVINTDLTAQLVFEDNSSIYVRITDISAFHWLLGFANMKPLTDEELEVEKNKALSSRFEVQLNEAREEAISIVGYPKYGDKQAFEKAEAEILETTFKILQDTPEVARVLDYSEFVNVYQNTFSKRNVELDKPVNYYSDRYSGKGNNLFFIATIPILIYLVWNQSTSKPVEEADNGAQVSATMQISESTNVSKSTEPKEQVATEESKERVTSEDLVVRNDIAFLPNEDKPFTGRYETFYPNGNKKGVAHLKDGKFNGLMTLWDENGQKVSERNIKDGVELPINEDQKGGGKANTQGGFDSFRAEAENAKNKLECPNSVDSDITPAAYDGDGALYGCVQGKAQTVKWFINEVPNSNRVSNVKFMWNDWFKDMGYGLHPDKQEAQKALKVLIKLYAPEKSKELNKTFFGNSSKTITLARFTIKYTYDHGPAIDERMIVVTER